MTFSLSANVGYRSPNNSGDVLKIHQLLRSISVADGGAGPGFDPYTPYNQAITDTYIFNFQVKQFGRGPQADAVVSKVGPTLDRLNALAASSTIGDLGNGPAPSPKGGVAPAKVLAVLEGAPIGHTNFAYLPGYDPKAPDNQDKRGFFRVPTYRLNVGLATKDGARHVGPTTKFEVVRFGIRFHKALWDQGRSFGDCFKIQGPKAKTYKGLKKIDYDGMPAWFMEGDYMVHPGPREPTKLARDPNNMAGALGCVEICGRGQWTVFDEVVRTIAFNDYYQMGIVDAATAEKRIAEACAFTLIVEPAATPPLVTLSDFTARGGPRPVRQ